MRAKDSALVAETGDPSMDKQALARQALLEHELLEHLKQALRAAMSWSIDIVGLERKRSTVCFTADSLGRHLERLMELEEDGGYMRDILERKPHLAEQIATLRSDHEVFRGELAIISPRVERPLEVDEGELCSLCTQIGELLAQVDRHDRREIDLFQDGLLSEEGTGD
jgi:hypothetical protein